MNTMLTTLTLTGKACRRGFFVASVLLAAAIACKSAGAQDLNRKAPPQNEPIVIENAIVHTASISSRRRCSLASTRPSSRFGVGRRRRLSGRR